MNLLGRRRVILDHLAGALWVLPTVSVLVFLLAGAALSRVELDEGSPLARLAFQGTADDARSLLIVVSSTMITVTGLVFARVAVSGSLALALASVGVLIYFIHHLAHSIQIDTIMSQVEREARSVIGEVYPRRPRDREPEELCPEPPNDPYTGVQAVHHLSVLLCDLARRRLGDWTVHDGQGELRVAVPRPKFPDSLRLGTAQIRRFGAGPDPRPDPAPARRRHQLGHRGPPPRLRPPHSPGPRRRPAPPPARPTSRRSPPRPPPPSASSAPARPRRRPGGPCRPGQAVWAGTARGASQSMWWS